MKRLPIYTVFIALLAFASCKKYVEIPPPTSQLVSGLVFTDDKTATASMVGIYSRMNAFNGQFANVAGNYFPAFSADEFHYGFASANYDEFKDNTLIPSNTNLNALWEPVYSMIYHANSVIEGLTNNTSVTETTRKQLLGEALFMRAFFNFYLVNYFGDIPLILNTDYRTNTSLPRTAVSEVYTSIINDLKDAQGMIGDAYIGTERIRPNKAAVTTLLARTYLYRGMWADAEREASTVIGDNRYSLLGDLNSVFLRNSNEAIWQLQTVNTSTAGVNTWEGFSLVPFGTGTPLYRFYPNFVGHFEENDKRRTSWVASFTNAAGTYHYPFKYKLRTNTPVVEYSMVLRFAELFLIRAEARAQQDNFDGAVDDLNRIRGRAGIIPLEYGMAENDLMLAIEKERKLELFSEWGHRWLDLKRTGRALTVLGAIKPNIDANDLLYPIPLPSINSNPNLVQNPGYF